MAKGMGFKAAQKQIAKKQGVSGSPKKAGESEAYRKRRESFKARHASNIAKGKMSAAYWADKVKW